MTSNECSICILIYVVLTGLCHYSGVILANFDYV